MNSGWALWEVSARFALQAIESLSEVRENMLPLPSMTLRSVGIGWGKCWPDGVHRKPFTSFVYPARLLKTVLPKHEGITQIVVRVKFTLGTWKIAGEIFFSLQHSCFGNVMYMCRCGLEFQSQQATQGLEATELTPKRRKLSGKKGALSEVNNSFVLLFAPILFEWECSL